MTEAEALEVAGIYAGNAITSFTVYVTFTMAYLVASYYVGARLTSFQTIAVSALYLFASAAPMLSLVTNILIYGEALTVSAIGQNAPLSSGIVWAVGMTSLMSIGILVSFTFMWQVRHPKKA